MAIKDLQGKEICAIIKTCASAGVSEFEIGDFKVKFGTRTPEPEGTTAPTEGTQSLPPQLGIVEEQNQTEQVDLLQERAKEDLAHAQILIDNPSEFEANLIDDMINEKGRDNDSKERGRA